MHSVVSANDKYLVCSVPFIKRNKFFNSRFFKKSNNLLDFLLASHDFINIWTFLCCNYCLPPIPIGEHVRCTHRIKDDRMENYGAYIGFISK